VANGVIVLEPKQTPESAETLEKQMSQLLDDIHVQARKAVEQNAHALARTIALFASLLGVLSKKADIQTIRIIRLTKALVGLTVALLLFTAYLSYDAYLKNKRIDQTRGNTSEKQKSNTQIAHRITHE
jgi:hypothetical protein